MVKLGFAGVYNYLITKRGPSSMVHSTYTTLVVGWTNPIWKIYAQVVKLGETSSPSFGVKIKHIWNHQPVN